ncbi:MAG: TetR/AcrR family transcriptional regulator [Deltaproteobacteria bacterium]|nr:TetR/AcrR family transcriptional regulator [Deltaproteobacteria bacterium]
MDRKEELRGVAQRLVRRSGFNSMSFADLAAEVGIRSATIHYHYPTKVALGVHLIERYHEAFFEELARRTEGVETAPARLQRYGSVFVDNLDQDGGLCLCGMLAAELPSLDASIRDGVKRFFEANTKWLASELRQGERRGELSLTRPASQVAVSLFSALEGAMLVARTLDNTKHLRDTVTFLVGSVQA